MIRLYIYIYFPVRQKEERSFCAQMMGVLCSQINTFNLPSLEIEASKDSPGWRYQTRQEGGGGDDEVYCFLSLSCIMTTWEHFFLPFHTCAWEVGSKNRNRMNWMA